METRKLGNTGLSVTALGYGAMELRLLDNVREPDHIITNAKAAQKGKLPDDVYAEAKQRLDAAGIVVKKA